MNVGDLMTKNPETAQMTDSIMDVASTMRDINVGFMPVMNGDVLAGVVTDRDIVVRAVANGMNSEDTSIGEIISSDIQAVSFDTDINEAASIMESNKIRRLPVVDENGALIGICSLGDIAVRGRNLEQSGEILELVSEPSKPELAA
jgi:CBS domain-containing protein